MARGIKQKAANREKKRDKRPRAVARFVRISPFKVRVVIDLIRGKKYGEAMAILEATPNAASPIVKKVLASAGANAEHNLGMSLDELYVNEVFADGGPTLKRVQPRAQGRAFRILKRTSHITVVLGPKNGKEVA